MRTQARQRDKWFALIDEQEKSGLTPSEFCKEHHLNLSRLHRYRHLLKKFKEAAAGGDIKEKLVPIKINAPQDSALMSEEIRLILSNGIQCILPSRAEPKQIKALIEVLMTC